MNLKKSKNNVKIRHHLESFNTNVGDFTVCVDISLKYKSGNVRTLYADFVFSTQDGHQILRVWKDGHLAKELENVVNKMEIKVRKAMKRNKITRDNYETFFSF